MGRAASPHFMRASVLLRYININPLNITIMKYIVISTFYLNGDCSVVKSFNNPEDAVMFRDIMQRNLHSSKYHENCGTLAPDYTYEVYEQIVRK